MREWDMKKLMTRGLKRINCHCFTGLFTVWVVLHGAALGSKWRVIFLLPLHQSSSLTLLACLRIFQHFVGFTIRSVMFICGVVSSFSGTERNQGILAFGLCFAQWCFLDSSCVSSGVVMKEQEWKRFCQGDKEEEWEGIRCNASLYLCGFKMNLATIKQYPRPQGPQLVLRLFCWRRVGEALPAQALSTVSQPFTEALCHLFSKMAQLPIWRHHCPWLF